MDPEATRTGILDAALGAFADRGFHGASIGEIASQAGVAKGLVQYHWATKRALWEAVFERELGTVLASVAGAVAQAPSFETLVRARFACLVARPKLMRLWVWASLDPGLLPDALESVGKDALSQVRGMVPALHPEGGFAAPIAVISALDGWLLFRPIYARLLGQDLEDPAWQERFLLTLLTTFDLDHRP